MDLKDQFFHRWNPKVGDENVGIYPPGQRCDAFPGCPVFAEHWAAIIWWPGRAERILIDDTESHLRQQLLDDMAVKREVAG